MPASDSHLVLRLPRHALRIIGIAFAAGLLLFVLVWLIGRHHDAFYTVEPDATAAAPTSVALPVPSAGAVGASGMHAPDPDSISNASANGGPATPSPFAAGNPLPPEATPAQPPVPAAPPAVAAPAPSATPVAPAAPTQANANLPTPIPGQNPPPEYPASAARRNETGHVLLRVMVDATGKPRDVDVIEKSGTRALDKAAVTAVRQWHFTPAQQDGKPVAASVDIPFDFALQH